MLSETKARKPYTKTKQRERWTEDEHGKFLEAVQLYGRAWRKIEEHIGTKSTVQIRSHAQKFFAKCERETPSSPHSRLSWGSGDLDEPSSTAFPDGTGKPDVFHVPPPRPKRKPNHPYPKKAGPAVHGEAPSSYAQNFRMSSTMNAMNVDASSDIGATTGIPTGMHAGGSTDVQCSYSSSKCNQVRASALWFREGCSDATSLGGTSSQLHSVPSPSINSASNLQAAASRANALASAMQQAHAMAAAAATHDTSSVSSFNRVNLSPASTPPQRTSNSYMSLLREHLASSLCATTATQQASTNVIADSHGAAPVPVDTVRTPEAFPRGTDALDSMRDWLNAMPAALRESGVEAVAAAVAAAAGGHFNPGTVLDPAVLASLATEEDSRRIPPAVVSLTAAALASASTSSSRGRGDGQGDVLHSGEQGQRNSRESRPCAGGASAGHGRNSRDSSPSLQTGSDGTGSDGGQPEQDDMGDAQALQRGKDAAAADHRASGLAGTADAGGPFAGFGYSAEVSPYHSHAAAGAGLSTLLGATQSTHAAAQAAAQVAAMQAAQAQATAAQAQHQYLLAIHNAVKAGHVQNRSQYVSQKSSTPRSSYSPRSNRTSPYNGALAGLPAWAAVPGVSEIFARALRTATPEAGQSSAGAQESTQDSGTHTPFAALSHTEALRVMQTLMSGRISRRN